MPQYPTTSFERSVDKAIAQENRRVEATLCRKCAGTGTLWIKLEMSGHRRERCDRCKGTGEA